MDNLSLFQVTNGQLKLPQVRKGQVKLRPSRDKPLMSDNLDTGNVTQMKSQENNIELNKVSSSLST